MSPGPSELPFQPMWEWNHILYFLNVTQIYRLGKRKTHSDALAKGKTWVTCSFGSRQRWLRPRCNVLGLLPSMWWGNRIEERYLGHAETGNRITAVAPCESVRANPRGQPLLVLQLPKGCGYLWWLCTGSFVFQMSCVQMSTWKEIDSNIPVGGLMRFQVKRQTFPLYIWELK